MSLTGNLRTMGPPDLLQFLELGRKTGTLRIAREDTLKEIFFRSGIIIGSLSNNEAERLGQYLLNYGKITEHQLSEALEKQRTGGGLFGEILISSGAISREELIQVMAIRTLEIIYDIFLREAGEFSFAENSLPDYLTIPVEIQPQSVIMEGVYRADEWKRYRELLRDDSVIGLAPGVTIDKYDASHKHYDLLKLAGEELTVSEIGYNLRKTPFHLYAELFEAVVSGLLVVKRDRIDFDHEDEGSRTESDVSTRLSRAAELIKSGDPKGAMRAIKGILEEQPQNGEAQVLHSVAEETFIHETYSKGFSHEAVPSLKLSLDELKNLDLNAQEGFILSRIDGTWDVGSIVDISPFKEAETLAIIVDLIEHGVVSIDDGGRSQGSQRAAKGHNRN